MSADELSQYEPSDRRVFIRAGLFGFLLLLTVFAFLPSNFGPLFRLFNIPATSMAPALNLGDFAVVSLASYGYSKTSFDFFNLPIRGALAGVAPPKRGDVVVFRLARDPKTVFVKRIVGLPGDKVQMIAGRLWIDGTVVPRDPAGTLPDPLGEKGQIPAYIEHLPGSPAHQILEAEGDTGLADDTELFVVPGSHYFVMGDNRDNSNDSRFDGAKGGLGYVPAESIIGRVVASF